MNSRVVESVSEWRRIQQPHVRATCVGEQVESGEERGTERKRGRRAYGERLS